MSVANLAPAFIIVVDGGWGSWTSWSSCDATCGGGLRTRQRYCDNPVPSGGGRHCFGSSSQQEKCNTASCPGEISEDLIVKQECNLVVVLGTV